MNKYREIYQRLVYLTSSAKEINDFPSLEPTEKMFLNLLSNYWLKNQKITVVESMKMTSKLSTSTMFRHLKALRKKGYVNLVVDEFDNRVKYVTATDITNAYFIAMGRMVVESMKVSSH